MKQTEIKKDVLTAVQAAASSDPVYIRRELEWVFISDYLDCVASYVSVNDPEFIRLFGLLREYVQERASISIDLDLDIDDFYYVLKCHHNS